MPGFQPAYNSDPSKSRHSQSVTNSALCRSPGQKRYRPHAESSLPRSGHWSGGCWGSRCLLRCCSPGKTKQSQAGAGATTGPEHYGDRLSWLLGALGHLHGGMLWGRVYPNPPYGLATSGGDGLLVYLHTLLWPPCDREGTHAYKRAACWEGLCEESSQ